MNKTTQSPSSDVTPSISNTSTINIINNENLSCEKLENTNNVPKANLITIEPKSTSSLPLGLGSGPSPSPTPPRLTVNIISEISSSAASHNIDTNNESNDGGNSGDASSGGKVILRSGHRGHGFDITETGEKLPRKSSLKKRVNTNEQKEIINPVTISEIVTVCESKDDGPTSVTPLDDDDVFSDSMPSPLPRSDWCVSYTKNRGELPGFIDLPYWFNTDDGERGGSLEPPNTPIGRDELALKRHRFFSDLRNAAEAASEHRVRFDPLGPFFAELAGTPDSISSCKLNFFISSRFVLFFSRFFDIFQYYSILCRLFNDDA